MEKKQKVFRRNYDHLKDGFSCTGVATLLYSKEVISTIIRDCQDPVRIVGAVEKALLFREEVWDILMNEVMVEPPLNSLAAIMLNELEAEMRTAPSRNNSGLISSDRSGHRESTPDLPPLHPQSLVFKTDPCSPTIDSGNWTSDKDKYYFPSFSPTNPTIPAIVEGSFPDSTSNDKSDGKNDSGIHVNHTSEKTMDDQPQSDTTPSSLFPPVQSKNESRSEMVSPHNEKSSPKDSPKKNSSHAMKNTIESLKLKNKHLEMDKVIMKETIRDLQEENDELKEDIASVNAEKQDGLELLEIKLDQLADDNHLLSRKIQEKRHLESENSKLLQQLKAHKREHQSHKREISRLKGCLEMAERNARVQSINIDKLRDQVDEKNAIIKEQKNSDKYHHWLSGTSDESFDSAQDYHSLPDSGNDPAYY